MLIHDLDTPALVCDMDVMERNITSMAAHCREIDIPLRVHAKSHKIPEIAHQQVAAGAIGICCQKLGEAEVMAAAGISDILVPYNIVGTTKVDRLMRLARRIRMTVAVDSFETAQGIAEGTKRYGGIVRVLVEMDTGSHRCGVQSPEAALALAQQIIDLPGIDFQGVMTYPSRPQIKDFLDKTASLFKTHAVPLHVISGGGTGLEAVSKELGCTETRSGSYIWEGLSRVHGRDDLAADRCPLRIIATVVSTPAPGRIIIDGGMKTFTSYPPVPYGYCIEHPGIKIYGMSVEHGHVDVSESSHQFKVGERLSIIPLHQGMTLNLHDELVGYRGEQVEVIWPVLGRGKVK